MPETSPLYMLALPGLGKLLVALYFQTWIYPLYRRSILEESGDLYTNCNYV